MAGQGFQADATPFAVGCAQEASTMASLRHPCCVQFLVGGACWRACVVATGVCCIRMHACAVEWPASQQCVCPAVQPRPAAAR